MKAKLFFVLIAGFALSMLSCNSDPVGMPNDDTTVTYATGTGSDAPTDTIVTPYIPEPPGEPEIYPPLTEYPGPEEGRNPDFPGNLVFVPYLKLELYMDDIESYNVTTREIVFTDIFSKKLTTPNDEGIYRELTLYYNDKPLLEEIIITYPYDSNPWRGFIVLSVCVIPDYCDSPYHLYKKTQEYQAEWDIFIKSLKDAGKIVE